MLDLQVFAISPLITTCTAETVLKATVLLIEDDEDIANLITMYLNRDGIETVCRDDGESGLAAFGELGPDLVVLDINLPGMDGYEVLQQLKRTTDVPVLMVTARQEDEDAILGFGMGADDYVAKPFSPKVLAARIRTHLSRARKVAAAVAAAEVARHDASYRFGPYVLDPGKFVLLRNGSKLPMSPREIELLVYLARAGGEPRSPEDLYHDVWDRQYGDLSTVAVHVQRIRKKIEEDPSEPVWLRTAHGRGYFLAVEPKA